MDNLKDCMRIEFLFFFFFFFICNHAKWYRFVDYTTCNQSFSKLHPMSATSHLNVKLLFLTRKGLHLSTDTLNLITTISSILPCPIPNLNAAPRQPPCQFVSFRYTLSDTDRRKFVN